MGGGRSDAQIGVVCQLEGPAPRPLGEVALVDGLNSPRDALDQVLFVERPRGLAEDLGVSAAQLRDGHLSQVLHRLVDIEYHHHASGVLSG